MAVDLSNKVVILTGASDGMGREIAYLKERLDDVARVIMENGGTGLVVPTDLRDQAQIANLVKTTIDTYGRVDILINVAGMGYYDFIEENTAEELREQFDVNVIAPIELIREVVPIMKAQKRGHIVNFASYASRIAAPPLTIYASTKYAIEGISDGLRRELSPWNIKVTRVHPSAVDTTFNAKAERHGGIHYPYDKLTGVTKEHVAKLVIKALKRPRIAIYAAKRRPIIDAGVAINRHLPFLIDWVMKSRVSKMWRKHSDHDLAPDLADLRQRKV
jgi:short-subunit dehydrogenase